MKKRFLNALAFGILLMILGGFLGAIAPPLVLKAGGHRVEFWSTTVSGNGPIGYLETEPNGNSGTREFFNGRIIYEHFSWIGNKPAVSRGIPGFTTMISNACYFTGWFVGICIGCFYVVIQGIAAFRDWHKASLEGCNDQAITRTY